MAKKIKKETESTALDFANTEEIQVCNDEFNRLLFYFTNGHYDFVDKANQGYRYFKGQQWTDEDKQYMEAVQGRKCITNNRILPAVQSATGEQIFTRAAISFDARKGQATDETATVLAKLALHVQVDNGYQRKEKTVWKDGLIKSRAYFDVRMRFDSNLNGDIDIQTCNPLTIMPDINSESYDPKDWAEFISYGWLSLDQIEGMYGKSARKKAEQAHGWYTDNPMSSEFRSANAIDQRYGFGSGGASQIYERADAGEKRLRVIERQFYKWTIALCYVDPKTGDSQPVPEHVEEAEAKKKAAGEGLLLARQSVKKVWWRVSTRFAMLHDSWSPYRSYTIIPFFYIFDYGDTTSMVENAIGPQDLENKSLTSFLHIINTVSNSGWTTEQNSLTNMTTKDLGEKGMKTGLVIEHKEGTKAPQKITPAQPPKGFETLMEKGAQGVKDVTGMQDADQNVRSHIPGDVAANAQFQQKMQLSDPLDNLEFTRILLGRKFLELFQDFYTAERVFKITEKDEHGKPQDQTVIINQVQAAGHILNDITLGEYDVTVTTKPTAMTYQQTQFNEVMKMRELKVAIPDAEVIRRSNLENKHELADQMSQPKDDGGAAKAQMEMVQAKVKETLAKATSAEAKAITEKIQGIFGAVNAARILAMVPGAAPLADDLLLSAGFTDAQIPEPISGAPAGGAPGSPPAPDANSHPNFPPSAAQGMDAGIEGGMAQ